VISSACQGMIGQCRAPWVYINAAKLKQCLEEDSSILTDWFNENGIKLIPVNVKLSASAKTTLTHFQITDQVFECQTSAKLLGVELDYLFNFDLYISNICRKASSNSPF
jgi:hypothetical protein